MAMLNKQDYGRSQVVGSIRGGSSHPCRLRTDRLAPVSKFELCTGTCAIYGVT
jgi:hypothetical protein